MLHTGCLSHIAQELLTFTGYTTGTHEKLVYSPSATNNALSITKNLAFSEPPASKFSQEISLSDYSNISFQKKMHKRDKTPHKPYSGFVYQKKNNNNGCEDKNSLKGLKIKNEIRQKHKKRRIKTQNVKIYWNKGNTKSLVFLCTKEDQQMNADNSIYR